MPEWIVQNINSLKKKKKNLQVQIHTVTVKLDVTDSLFVYVGSKMLMKQSQLAIANKVLQW